MARSVTIPLRSDLTDYEFGITLDRINYVLRFVWNTRERAWYFDISTEDAEPIVMGSKLVVDAALARRSQDPRRPPGYLIAVDTSGRHADPGIADLGARVQLLYFPAIVETVSTSTDATTTVSGRTTGGGPIFVEGS